MTTPTPEATLVEMDGYVLVPLSQGLSAKIDIADVPLIAGKKWSASKNKRTAYAVRGSAATKQAMHRLIIGARPGEIVDHINSDGLDNRRLNLRIVDRKGNARNSRPHSKFGFKGVSKNYHVTARPFYARILIDGRKRNFGSFATAEEAARKYDELAKAHFGEHAWLNFPNS